MNRTLINRHNILWIFAIFFLFVGCEEGQGNPMKVMQERFDQAHEDAKQAVDEAIAEVNRTVEGQMNKY